jgi:hypothetical protein
MAASSKKKAIPSLAPPPVHTRGTVRRHLAWCGVVVAVTVALYARSFNFGFTQDDGPILTENLAVQNGSFIRILTRHFYDGSDILDRSLYRPLPKLTLAFTYSFAKLAPAAYHATNVALHALAGIAIFLLLLEMMPSLAGPTALLFVVAPVATETVCNIKNREEILACLFGVLTWLFFIRSAKEPARAPRRSAIAVGALFLLALLSKESAVMFAGVVVIHDLVTKPYTGSLRTRAHLYTALGVAGTVWLVLRWHAVRGAGPINIEETYFDPSEGFWTRALTMSKVIVLYYLGDSVFTLRLSPDFSSRFVVPTESPAHPTPEALACAAALLLAAVGTALLLRYRRQVPAFWVMFFVLMILPASNLFFSIGTLGAFRLMYAPALALWALLILTTQWFWSGLSRNFDRLLLMGFAGVAALRYPVVAWERTTVWATNDAAQRRVLELTPDYPKRINTDPARAEQLWNSQPKNLRGSDLRDYVLFLNGEARDKLAGGNVESARELAERARELARKNHLGEAYEGAAGLVVARTWMKQNDPQRAIPVLVEAIQGGVRDSLAYALLAEAARMSGKEEGLDALFNRRIAEAQDELSPSAVMDFYYLKNTLTYQSMYRSDYETAVRLAEATLGAAARRGDKGPYVMTAAMYRAKSAYELKRFDDVLSLRRYLADTPGTAQEIAALLDLLVDAAVAKGDTQAAQNFCEKGAASLPPPWPSHFLLRKSDPGIVDVPVREPDVVAR